MGKRNRKNKILTEVLLSQVTHLFLPGETPEIPCELIADKDRNGTIASVAEMSDWENLVDKKCPICDNHYNLKANSKRKDIV